MNTTKTKPRNPKLNVRLLRRIQKHILEEPLRFLMRTQLMKRTPGAVIATDDWRERQQVPECGTVACIAGWALLLSHQPIRENSPWGSVRSRAAKILGLPPTVVDNDELFQVWGWPEKFRARYREATLPRTRAKIAADRIEHLIKTGS